MREALILGQPVLLTTNQLLTPPCYYLIRGVLWPHVEVVPVPILDPDQDGLDLGGGRDAASIEDGKIP